MTKDHIVENMSLLCVLLTLCVHLKPNSSCAVSGCSGLIFFSMASNLQRQLSKKCILNWSRLPKGIGRWKKSQCFMLVCLTICVLIPVWRDWVTRRCHVRIRCPDTAAWVESWHHYYVFIRMFISLIGIHFLSKLKELPYWLAWACTCLLCSNIFMNVRVCVSVCVSTGLLVPLGAITTLLKYTRALHNPGENYIAAGVFQGAEDHCESTSVRLLVCLHEFAVCVHYAHADVCK